MPLPFVEEFKNKEETTSNSKGKGIDVYDLLAMSLKIGIRLEDWKDMSFVGLANVLYSSMPKDKEKAQQKDIDMLLG